VEIFRPTKTSHEFVRESLRNAILVGEFAPGTRLVQADIAKRLEVSTTPVREALRDLASEGLVRLDAYRGALITPLDRADLDEIFESLQALEPLAIRRAVANIGPDDLAKAESIVEEIDHHPDGPQFVRLDRQFHGVFAAAAQAPRLRSMVESLRDSAGLYIAASFRRSAASADIANEDHLRLVAAVRAGDIEAAVEVEREHLYKAHERWLETLGLDEDDESGIDRSGDEPQLSATR
jgi:DNA-binding GntR family transcriptional regulator